MSYLRLNRNSPSDQSRNAPTTKPRNFGYTKNSTGRMSMAEYASSSLSFMGAM